MAKEESKAKQLKDKIIKAKDIKVDGPHYVPEWELEVFLKVMSASSKDQFELSLWDIKVDDDGTDNSRQDLKHFRGKLLVNCLCDEDGDLLFNDREYMLLGRKSASSLEPLVDRAKEINGISRKDEKELVKNLKDGQAEDSPSV